MEITFATKKLMKQMNDSREMVKVHGAKRAKKLQIVLTQLLAAPDLGAFTPPYSPPHRCHELTGNRKGQLSMDLDHPYRLIFKPDHDPVPERSEGGLNWRAVTEITIIGVVDTHG
ncbi:MAG TPA: hypothetical protein VFM78_09680 [Marinobacter sp.]|nr:hypothetical protein [Marinobacter sp.]